MTPESSPTSQEVESLGESLCRGIAAHRYEEAQKLIDRCLELHTAANHHLILSILERARRLAIVQWTLVPQRLARLESAARYAANPGDGKHYIVSG
jgi:hypothetical protein